MIQSILFAEATTNTNVDVAELARHLGPGWFFIVLCFVLVGVVVLGLGFIAYKLGGKLMDRLDAFLEGVGKSSADNASILASHAKASSAAAVNIANLCDAGHNFANAIEAFGKGVGVDVSKDCEKIHEKLRTILQSN